MLQLYVKLLQITFFTLCTLLKIEKSLNKNHVQLQWIPLFTSQKEGYQFNQKSLHHYQRSKNQFNSYSFEDTADFRVLKIQFIPSVHSWDTVNFRAAWTGWPHLFLNIPIPQFFDQRLICINMHKIRLFHWFFLRCGWSKNPAIWLDENIWPISRE